MYATLLPAIAVPAVSSLTNTVGAEVSMLMVRVPAVLALPAASVAVALRVSVPWPMAVMSSATNV